MTTYSEPTAWLVTCISGLTTGVILGSQTSVGIVAFVGVTLSIACGILVCAKLLNPADGE